MLVPCRFDRQGRRLNACLEGDRRGPDAQLGAAVGRIGAQAASHCRVQVERQVSILERVPAALPFSVRVVVTLVSVVEFRPTSTLPASPSPCPCRRR